MNGRVCVLISLSALSFIRFREPLVKELQEAGWRVVLMAPDYGPATEARVRELGAEPARYPAARVSLNPLKDLKTLLYLRRYFASRRVDMLIAWHAKANIYGTIAGALAGVGCRVATVVGLGFAFSPGKRSARKVMVRLIESLLLKLSFSFAHRVMFQNNDDREELVRLRIVKREKTNVVGGTGVCLNEWVAEEPQLAPLTFTFIGRLRPEKGIREFAAAAEEVKRTHPDVRFILVAPPDPRPDAVRQDEVAEWVRNGILTWEPWLDDVRPVLRNTSVYVHPSYYREGVPRAIQEAMAMARPVITTDVPGCRETVIHGRNGLLIPAADVRALTSALLFFIDHPNMIHTMGYESRKLAEQRFDARRLAKNILASLPFYEG